MTTCPTIPKPITVEDVASRVKEALESNDLERFAELLSPDVQWGAPGAATPACREPQAGPAVVLEGAGGRAPWPPSLDVEVRGNAVLVGFRLEGEGERWQVLRVGPEGVYDIRGFEDRAQGRRGIVALSWTRARGARQPLHCRGGRTGPYGLAVGAGRVGADRV